MWTELAVTLPSLSTLNTVPDSVLSILIDPLVTVISPFTLTVPASKVCLITALSAVNILATKVSNSNWVASIIPVHFIRAVWSSSIWALDNLAFLAWIKSAVIVFAINLLTVVMSVYPTSFDKEDTLSPVWTELAEIFSDFSPKSILSYLFNNTLYVVETTLRLISIPRFS